MREKKSALFIVMAYVMLTLVGSVVLASMVALSGGR